MTRPCALGLLVLTLGSGCVPDPGPAARSEETYLHVLAVEDARPTGGTDLDFLLAATASRSNLVRRTAVRALGRLEKPELAARIAPHLDDPDLGVRAEAAAALAQSVHGTDGAPVLDALLSRAERERDGTVRGALAASLGALRLDLPERRRVVRELVTLSGGDSPDADVPIETLLGVAMGFESLVRGVDDVGLSHSAAARLERLMLYRADDSTSSGAGHIRALAIAALSQARRMSVSLVDLGLRDLDPEVRRQAVRSLDAVVPAQREPLIRRALADTSQRVSLEAIRYLSQRSRTAFVCSELMEAADPDAHAPLRVFALEALARPCEDPTGQRSTLTTAANELAPGPDSEWQPAARGLISLARIDPDAATALLPRFARHSSPFVRAHAAEAAGILGDETTLGALASDASANVRTAALRGLFDHKGHAIDGLLTDALSEDDPQLLVTVAGLLEGAPRRSATAASALAAFERVSSERQQTSRDSRRALLARVAELGNAALASRLTPYLADYDPLVARDVADLLTSWTGERVEAHPKPLPRAPLPTVQELEALRATTVILHMRGGGSVVIRPLPDVALTNSARFVRLVRAGYYDGLSFHRWAPNFVIQGGSPGANEYSGDGPYTRDEIGRQPHWRGAVGVSTRGRDTGDGQLFIDLVDNPRLDGEYTVFGLVVAGMDVVDRVLEGTVIDRAEVRVES